MTESLDRRAVGWGLAAAGLLVLGIYFGSGELKYLDRALISYTSACVFAIFGIVYRYNVWLQKPPTALYWRRGWELFLRPAHLPRNIVWLVVLIWRNVVLQTFIMMRSHLRWGAHLLISWGCITAAAVTFPLVFGWVHFEPAPQDPMVYEAFVFGIKAGAFPHESPVGWITFHILDFCAVAILIGIAFAFRRRMRDRGAMAVQQFSMDFLPLVMLVSICVTGLMLTVSSLWMHGQSYDFIALVHAYVVIVTLLYLPFGKFFHIFQRPAQMGVQFYKMEGAVTEQALCRRCGESYASLMQVQDLKTVLDRLGLDQQMPVGHFQEVCPACRRRLLALNQLKAIGGPGFL